MAQNKWLLKSEPDTFSWQDLVRDGKARWDGVRNAGAAIHLRNMRKGDVAFFYHSGATREIVGVMKITRAAYPDPTFQPKPTDARGAGSPSTSSRWGRCRGR